MSDKIQISEKQAREILDYVWTDVPRPCIDYNTTIAQWHIRGYIKQSKLEEANTEAERLLRRFNTEDVDDRLVYAYINQVRRMYQAAIAELLEDKSNG